MKYMDKVKSLLLVKSLLHFSLAILAFVILKDGVSDSEEAVIDGLKVMVKKGVGSFAVPHRFLVSFSYLNINL